MKNGETEECNVQAVILFIHNEVQFMLTSNNMSISPIKKPAGISGTPSQPSRYTPASVRRISPNLSLVKKKNDDTMRSAIHASAGKTIEMTPPNKRLFTETSESSGRDLESQSLLEKSSAIKVIDLGDFIRLQSEDARLSLPDSVSTTSFTSLMDEEEEEERNSVWNRVLWWLQRALHYVIIIVMAFVLYGVVVGILSLTDAGLYREVLRDQSTYFLSGLFWLGLLVCVVVGDWLFNMVCGGPIKRTVNWCLSRPNYEAV